MRSRFIPDLDGEWFDGEPATRVRVLAFTSLLATRTIDYALSSRICTHERALLLRRLLDNPSARNLAWTGSQQRRNEIQVGLGGFSDGYRRDDRERFYDARLMASAQRPPAVMLEDMAAGARLASARRLALEAAASGQR